MKRGDKVTRRNRKGVELRKGKENSESERTFGKERRRREGKGNESRFEERKEKERKRGEEKTGDTTTKQKGEEGKTLKNRKGD